MADFSDLDVLVNWVDRTWAGRAATGGCGSSSPSSGRRPMSRATSSGPTSRARGRRAGSAAGLRIARRWPRIYTPGWITLRDGGSRPSDGRESRTGLIDAQGRRKRAFNAYGRG